MNKDIIIGLVVMGVLLIVAIKILIFILKIIKKVIFKITPRDIRKKSDIYFSKDLMIKDNVYDKNKPMNIGDYRKKKR